MALSAEDEAFFIFYFGIPKLFYIKSQIN